jgi:hypothetical protein
MAYAAVHARPSRVFTPGQKLVARTAGVLLLLAFVSFQYGLAGRNPIADAVTTADTIWTISTNIRAAAMAVAVYLTIRYLRPSGAHRA